MASNQSFLFLILIFVSQINIAITSSCEQQERVSSFGPTWDERQHYLPEFMRVQGTASGYLPAEQVIIEFDIETLSDSAGTSLIQNNQSISQAVNLMKAAGIEEKELSTQDLRIYPSHKSEYDEIKKTYKEIFEGYKVENKLRFISKKIELAGKVIDIAVSSGINKVSSVQIVPTQTKIKELKDSLISLAVDDAIKRANLALGPLNYEIKSVKSINLDNNSRWNNNLQYQNSRLDDTHFDNLESSDDTQIFQSNKKFSVSVDVSFIIGKKEITN